MDPHDIEILIPVKGSVTLARDTVLHCLSSLDASKITVSVNGATTEQRPGFLDLEKIDPRVSVLIQRKDLGLYGNMRFLVEEASRPWLQIVAVDDRPDFSVVTGRRSNIAGKHPALIVGPQVVTEVALETKSDNFSIVFGRPLRPVVTEEKAQVFLTEGVTGLDAPTSWIFGLWRSEVIKAIFPKTDFNWLDSFLVAEAIARDGLIYVPICSGKSVIGKWPGRPPNAVGKSAWTPVGWLFHSLLSASQRKRFGSRAIVGNWRVGDYAARLKRRIPSF